jgi:hypothetical protein
MNRVPLLLISGCVFTLLSATCAAESFSVVGSGEGYVAFADTDGAAGPESIKIYNLVLVYNPAKLVDDHPMHYMIEREKLDCQHQTIEMLDIKAFGPDNQMFEKADGADGAQLILPNSLALSQFNLICRSVRFSTTTPDYKSLPSAVQAGDVYAKAFVFKIPTGP